MKRLMFTMLALAAVFCAYAKGDSATGMSTPSPAVSNRPLEVKITTTDFGSEVYCYSWYIDTNEKVTAPWGWDDVYIDKLRMSGSNGTYSLTINSIKEFYNLTDAQLASLKKLGFIAKTRDGRQTEDIFVDVVQGVLEPTAYSGGEGTVTSPYILKTAADLQELASTPGHWAPGVNFRMEADIDATDLTVGIGAMENPFHAVFDGNGHTITNLNILSTTIGNPIGLFNCIQEATIRNLGVTDAKVSGTAFTGILVGYMKNGLIERCFTAGSVKGTSICVGGLVGENEAGEILDCYSGANVENPADYVAGGLVGKNRGEISNTYSAGAVTGYDYVGGLVGANYGKIINSLALNASVKTQNDFGARFGGNSNQRNTTVNTHSWEAMETNWESWLTQGDHAQMKASSVFQDKDNFTNLTGWNFNDVWEWKVDGEKQYPVLRRLANQGCYLSQAYFEGGTSSISSKDIDTQMKFFVSPNPTVGELTVTAAKGVKGYAIYSINGALLQSGNPSGDHIITIDLGGESAGLYLLSVTDMEGNETVKKIIKK